MCFKNGDSVAVIVLSYNSADTVRDTLDSVYRQTYQNIELVVADDGSADNTVAVESKWLEENGDRFERIVFIKDHPNYGISRSLNVAVKACRSKWLKDIGADDILMDKCIEWCVEACCSQNDCSAFQANEWIINENNELTGYSYAESYRMQKAAALKSVKDQYRAFLFDDIKLSPTLFYNHDAYEMIGGCDESIRNIEDYPLKLKLLKNGYRIGFVNKPTVKYRIHQSVSHDTTRCYRPEHWKLRRNLVRTYCYPDIPIWRLDYWASELNDVSSFYVTTVLFRNKKTVVSEIFLRIMLLVNPKYIYNRYIGAVARNSDSLRMSTDD